MERTNKKIMTSDDVEIASNSPDDKRILKRWGYITAYPNEYLIQFRKGKLLDKTSGQGASCFKRINDTVFIIPTSLKEVIFQANQLTVDNVDVRIRGIVIYRINDPLRISKFINFSSRQRSEEKLARMIGDLCRSTAKWLVANMPVEECMRKRKEEIADSLVKEIGKVIEDPNKGWGIEVNTIDIQDVFIQDGEIFESLQQIFKSDKKRESALKQIEIEKDIEQCKINRDTHISELKKDNEMKMLEMRNEVKDKQIQLTRKSEEEQFKLDTMRVEENERISDYKQHKRIERDRKEIELQAEKARGEFEARKIANTDELRVLKDRIDIENGASPAALERHFIEKALPFIAETMAKSMQDVKMHIIQEGNAGSGAASPLRFMLMEIIDLFRTSRESLTNTQNGKEVAP